MTRVIEYTSSQNMDSYSDAINSVVYDEDESTLYVTWKANPTKAYAYICSAAQAKRAMEVDVTSVRANVKAVTDSLQRLFPIDGVEFLKRSTESTFKIFLTVNGKYEVEMTAENIGAAVARVEELFSQGLTGNLTVEGVTRV